MKEYLKNSGYRTIVNASLLNGIGNSLFNIVFVIYASTLPFKELAVTLASMAVFVPSLLDIFISWFSDQTKRKTQHVLGARIGQFLLFVLLAILITRPASVGLFLLLLLINIVSDCLGIYGGGLLLPVLKRIVPSAELENAMGFQTSTNTLAQLVFQGLGAWLIVLLHHNFSLFGVLNALTFLLAAAILFSNRTTLIQAEPQKPKTAKEPFLTSIKTTFQLLFQNRFLRTIMIFALLVNSLSASMDGLINLTLLNNQHLWFVNYGNTVAMVGIALSIGIIIGSLLANDWFKNSDMLTLIVLIMFLIALMGLNFWLLQNRWLMIGGMFACGYLMGKINPRLSAFMIREIDEERLAVTSGIFSTIIMLGGPLAQVFFLGIANLATPILSWQIYLVATVLIGLGALVYKGKVSEPTIQEADA